MSTTLVETKSKYRYWILHLLCWSVIIVVPMFFHSSSEDTTMVLNRYVRWLGNPLAYMLVFYINYVWLVPRFLLKKNDWKMFVLLNVFVIVTGLFAVDSFLWLSEYLLPDLPNNSPGPRNPM